MGNDTRPQAGLQSERLMRLAAIIREGFPYPSDLQNLGMIADFLRNEKLFDEFSVLAHNWRRTAGVEPYPVEPAKPQKNLNPDPVLRKDWLYSFGRYGAFSIRISTIGSMSETHNGATLIRTSEGNFYSDEPLHVLEEKLKRRLA